MLSFHRIALAAPMLALAACGEDGARAPAAEDIAPVAAPAPSPAETIATAAPCEPAPLASDAAKGEEGARNILLAWACALEQGDFATAYAQWGADAAARSGRTEAEHAAYWAAFRTIAVAVPEGRMEGAAGSSYYEVPATITGERTDGTAYRLEGPVVLRRVNDVPGATAEQLRWHIESVDLEPAG
jgi:hypothetical protein